MARAMPNAGWECNSAETRQNEPVGGRKSAIQGNQRGTGRPRAKSACGTGPRSSAPFARLQIGRASAIYGRPRTGRSGPPGEDHVTIIEKGGAAAPQAASDLIKETTTKTFVQDVIEESKRQPVLIDFWAPWCGPCRQLTPILENAVRAAKGRVKMVKMNI